MYEVANVELCKEMFELSGWLDAPFTWGIGGVNQTPGYIEFLPDKSGSLPAYDLSYLLDKLPACFIAMWPLRYKRWLRLELSPKGWHVTFKGVFMGAPMPTLPRTPRAPWPSGCSRKAGFQPSPLPSRLPHDRHRRKGLECHALRPPASQELRDVQNFMRPSTAASTALACRCTRACDQRRREASRRAD